MTNREVAQAKFHALFARLVRHSGAITSFRRALAAALPIAVKAMEAEDVRFVTTIAPDVIIGDVAAFLAEGSAATLGRAMANSAARSAEEMAEASVLVFAHAVLDDAALTCCEISTLLARNEWAEVLAGTKVTLADARGDAYERLLDAAIVRRLAELERGSLLDKLDVIFARCRPKPGVAAFEDAPYDRARVYRLDELRHRLIHDPALRVEIAKIDAELWYLIRLPFLLISVLHDRFGLTIDPKLVMGEMAAVE